MCLSASACTFPRGNQKEAILEIKKISADAYFSNSPALYNKALKKCAEVLAADSSNRYAKYYAAYNMFNYMGLIESDSAKRLVFENYASKAREYLLQLADDSLFCADSYVLLEGIYSILLNVYPSQKNELVPKIGDCFVKGVKADSINPRLYLHSGIFYYFTAKKMKGKTEPAIRDYKKAVELFAKEKPKDELAPDWGFAQTLAFLGRAYDDIGKDYEAEVAYKAALQLRPDYLLVQKVLYPALIKKKNNRK